jgi:3-oxoacyl-[acyl-carrier protein] reductase
MQIANKTALVLGGTRGIGKALSIALAEQRANIITPYYDWPDDTKNSIAILDKLCSKHLAVRADLRNPEDVKKLISKSQEAFGTIDILINNIERGGMPIVHGPYTPEQWALEFDTTLKAKWWVFNEALPLLKKSPEAAVVNISSIAGRVGRSGPAGLIFNDGYAAANRAISSLTETWSRMAAPTVRVNELMLGFFKERHAEGTRGWDLLSSPQQEEIKNRTLLKRTGELHEIVKTVFFLIKDATFMTGSCICLDGGYSLGHDSVPAIPTAQDNLGIFTS